MNIRDDDLVSAVALVMESEADTGAPVDEPLPGRGRRQRPAPAERPGAAEAATEPDLDDERRPDGDEGARRRGRGPADPCPVG